MYRNIRAPKRLPSPITVDTIEVHPGERVRQQQILAYLNTPTERLPIIAPCDGWIKLVAVREKNYVTGGELLFTIDIMATEDYQVDHQEVNGATELGVAGRRGAERDGQRQFAESYAAELFENPETQQGVAAQGTKAHPLMANAKEGVPLKMSASASDNQAAVDQFSEEASKDPELQKQLSHQLQQQLNIQPDQTPSPTLTVR